MCGEARESAPGEAVTLVLISCLSLEFLINPVTAAYKFNSKIINVQIGCQLNLPINDLLLALC